MLIRKSAHRHGLSRADILWAIEHALATADIASRAAPEAMAVLYLGPDRNGRLLEVVATGEDGDIVIHAMPMRRHYGYLLEKP